MASNFGVEDDYEVILDDDDVETFGDNEVLNEDDDNDEDVLDRDEAKSRRRSLRSSSNRGRKRLKLIGESSRTGRSGLTEVVPSHASQSVQCSQQVCRVSSDQIEARRLLATKIDRICEFTLVLMHCILYKINYYNRKTHFDKAIKYDIIIYVCLTRLAFTSTLPHKHSIHVNTC